MSVARQLGRYRIGERIGSGGVADVYRAQVEGAAGFAKTLVVKCLRPHVAQEAELVEALTREAKLAQRLTHGNIVQVFDFGVEDGQPYVVMEHVDGCSLYELLRDLGERGQTFPLEEALFVAEEVGAALRYAHGLTDDDGTPLLVVHRDVKPRNVLISREGVVKLTDFGIAKVAGDREATLPGVIKGTPAYLSPEQALGRGVDARTDVFALGLLLRDVLGDGFGVDLPADPRADAALWTIYETATADDPGDRFDDVAGMLRALRRWRNAQDIDADPGQLADWVRRARQQAPVAVPVSLDAALLGGGLADDGITPDKARTGTDSTRPGDGTVHTTRTGSNESSSAAPLHRGFLALAAAFAVGGVVWATMADGEPEPRPLAPTTVDTAPQTPVLEGSSASAPDPSPSPSVAAESTDSTATSTSTSAGAESPPAPTTSGAIEPGSSTTEPLEAAPPSTTTGRTPGPSARPRTDARPGRLVVNVLPWAEVTVDGRPQGRVPVELSLPAGRHRVRLHNPQLGDVTKVIQLSPGQTYTLNKW